MKEKVKILLNGIIKENPVWVLVLGTCPTLATTSTVLGGVGMGVSVLFVLICSNIVISALKNVIPDHVRIPSFIVIIAGFVTVIGFLIQGFFPSLYSTLGIYLPLIVVNCIILARAEAFACKNSVFDSVIDAVGMGVGFTLALFLLASTREILGNGTWFGVRLIPSEWTVPIFSSPAGGFLAFAVLIATATKLSGGSEKRHGHCGHCTLCSEEKTK